MTIKIAASGIGVTSTCDRTSESSSFQAAFSWLVSEMTRLIRTKEPGKFSPPFRLVIIGNRGRVALAARVDRNGKLRPSGPLRDMRRSHFPANAFVTDRFLVTRTFRIDCTAH
jgi:hypothetical protein